MEAPRGHGVKDRYWSIYVFPTPDPLALQKMLAHIAQMKVKHG